MNQKPTFVGPVTTERAVLGGKRVLSSYFLLLPTGGDPIKLEYLDKVQAGESGRCRHEAEGFVTSADDRSRLAVRILSSRQTSRIAPKY